MVSKVAQQYLTNTLKKAGPLLYQASCLGLLVQLVNRVCNTVFSNYSPLNRHAIKILHIVPLSYLLIPFSNVAMAALAITNLAVEMYLRKNTIADRPSIRLPSFLVTIYLDPNLALPDGAKKYFGPFKEAISCSIGQIQGKTGFSLSFFAELCILQDQKNLSGYQVFTIEKSVLGPADVKNLTAFLRQHPKTIIWTKSQDIFSQLAEIRPNETKIYCFIEDDSVEHRDPQLEHIQLGTLNQEDSLALMTSWLNSPNIKEAYPHLAFDADAIKAVYQIVDQLNQADDSLPIKIDGVFASFLLLPVVPSHQNNIQLTRENIFPLCFTSLRPYVSPTRLIPLAKKIAEEQHIDFPYDPKSISKPSYLTSIASRETSMSRKRHCQSIRAALGGVEKPHAMVMNSSPSELRQVLRELSMEEVEIFEWNVDRMIDLMRIDHSIYSIVHPEFDRFLDYIWTHPKTILYIPYLSKFFQREPLWRTVLRLLPSRTSIIGTQILKDLNHHEDYLDVFKIIQLAPFSEQECKQAIQEWIEGDHFKRAYPAILFEEHSITAVIKMAFLLLGKSGREFVFAKDLIEMTIKKVQDTSISIPHLWNMFVELYPIEKGKIEISASDTVLMDASLFGTKLVKSLDEIALAINNEFNVTLPLQEKAPTQPPSFLENLNEKNREREQFAVGNERRLEELNRALRGLGKTNALLVGKPGTGKTTLIESIAWMIEHSQIGDDSPLHGKTIYSLDLNEMMKDTMYLGTIESRVSQLIAFLRSNKNVVLFIDEIHQIMGAGASSGNQMGSIAQRLKPYLTEPGIMVIGATTPGEAHQWMEGHADAAFKRRFKEVHISEPNMEECSLILKHLITSQGFRELYPGVIIDESVIKKAIDLANSKLSPIGQPDRAKDLLEKAANIVWNKEDKTVTEEILQQAFNQEQELTALVE